MQHVQQAFQSCDLLITPTTAITAPKIRCAGTNILRVDVHEEGLVIVLHACVRSSPSFAAVAMPMPTSALQALVGPELQQGSPAGLWSFALQLLECASLGLDATQAGSPGVRHL